MKGQFDRIESQLQSFIEENTARLFASMGIDKVFAHKLTMAMEAESQKSEDGSLSAPSHYGLYIHPSFANDVLANIPMLKKLTKLLSEAANQNGIHLYAEPTISVIPNDNISKGDFEIQALPDDYQIEETKGITNESSSHNINIPDKAFMIIQGEKILSLEEPVINIGRSLDNHIVIEETRVSRRHAQLRAVDGDYILFDLDSSGGTLVNGDRVSNTALQPGDVITIAGVPMVYGEGVARYLEETQEYNPHHSADDSTDSNSLTLNN